MSELTQRQRQVLEFIDLQVRERGYPPSVREIGEAVGLSSSSTVHAHLAALQEKGFLRRDPTKPRAIEVCFEAGSESVVERRPTRYVPLVGDVAAGTGVLAAESVEETLPLPEDFTGDGTLFMPAASPWYSVPWYSALRSNADGASRGISLGSKVTGPMTNLQTEVRAHWRRVSDPPSCQPAASAVAGTSSQSL